jgi:hypothetical protein
MPRVDRLFPSSRTLRATTLVLATGLATACGDDARPMIPLVDGGSPPPAEDAGEPVDPRLPRPIDGRGVYDDPSAGVATVPDLCPADARVAPSCLEEHIEGMFEEHCDGADNDCDGRVDENCPCTPGAVQRCFLGPPGLRAEGACQDGMQVCQTELEFGSWGECEGGIRPSAETCDDLDNDCNGCRDELEGCVPTGSCPGPDDPRVTPGRPFSTYELRGGDFYDGGDAVSWRWSVQGTPCDRMFASLPGSTATSENGQLSYTVRNATTENAQIDFTLSGDYEVTLEVERMDGSTFECTWIVHVRGPGVRVELCWDETGPSASDPADIDLHFARRGTTMSWFDAQDCHYMNCKGSSFGDEIAWGYPDTPIENCTGPGARGDFTDGCPNPRLDVDNIYESDEYVPENINVDNPNDGDEFRVMVHHYEFTDMPVRPMVSIYCGGELRGTYGAAPDFVEGFTQGGGRESGSMWRVADIRAEVAGDGTTTGCELTPIHPTGSMSGYAVTADDVTY